MFVLNNGSEPETEMNEMKLKTNTRYISATIKFHACSTHSWKAFVIRIYIYILRACAFPFSRESHKTNRTPEKFSQFLAYSTL